MFLAQLLKRVKIMATFQDLSEAVKEYFLDKNRDALLYDGWYDSTIGDFTTILELIGFYNTETFFSGFYSQGDGASYIGDYKYKKGCLKLVKDYAPLDKGLHDIVQGIVNIQKKYFYGITCSITQKTSLYSHENTMSFNFDNEVRADQSYGYHTVFNNEIDEKSLEKLFKDLARWLYKNLQTEYEYLTSDEALTDYFNEQDELIEKFY
jgi:hypothetical protein